jgi:hypothetical protein
MYIEQGMEVNQVLRMNEAIGIENPAEMLLSQDFLNIRFGVAKQNQIVMNFLND